MKRVIVFFTLFLFFAVATYFVFIKPKQVVIELGIMSSSYWDVRVYNNDRFFDEAIKIYEKENPNIKIVYRSGTLKSDYSEWLSRRLLLNKAPDVFYILPEDFNLLSSIGSLSELDSYLYNDTYININKFYTNGLKTGKYDNIQYAIPIEVNPSLMFVNKSLLVKESINIPHNNWTWDDLYKISEKVTKDRDGDGNLDQFGVYGFSWKDIVNTNGQKLFSDDGQNSFLDSQGVIDSINFNIKLNSLNKDSDVSNLDFTKGRVAFMPFKFSEYKAYKPYPYKVQKYTRFNWDCIELPKGLNGNNSSELYSALFGISSNTKHKKETWDFLKFMINDDRVQENILKYSFGIPIKKSILQSQDFDNELLKINGEVNSINTDMLNQVIENSIVSVKFRKYEDIINIVDTEIYKILNTTKDCTQYMINLNKSINNYLKK